MKIASFNVNNINRRLANLLHWLRGSEPDIVCLQELKAADPEFPADAIRQAGYHARGMARREALEWRGDPRAMDASRDPRGLARRRLRHTMPLS
jgi:exonuclease III